MSEFIYQKSIVEISPIAQMQSSINYNKELRCGNCERLLLRYNDSIWLNKSIQIKCSRCKELNTL